MNVPHREGVVKNGHPAPNVAGIPELLLPQGERRRRPRPAGPRAADAAKGRHRPPRTPTTVNTLTCEPDDENVRADSGGDADAGAVGTGAAARGRGAKKKLTGTTPGHLAAGPDFVGSEYQRRHEVRQEGTFCPDWVWLVTGSNKAEALVLARVAFWFAEKEPGKLYVTENQGGYWWLYKFYGQLAEELRVLTADEVRWAVRSLVGKGILVTHYDPKRRKSKLYRIDPAVVATLEEGAERRIDATRGR